MFTPRSIASLCTAALLMTVACAPQQSTPATTNTPPVTEQTKATLTTDVILTQSANGLENPITPEQIQSIKVGSRVVQRDQIKIIKGDFTTQQASDSDFEVEYRWDANGALNVGIFRLLSQFGAIGKVEVTYIENGETKTFSFVAGANTTGTAEGENLRITVNEDGTIEGGVASEDGSLNKDKPVFKTTTDQKLEVISNGTKTTFDLKAAADTEEGLTPESTGTATSDETDGIDVDPISPINLFVGNWSANLLGKQIAATIRDGGNSTAIGSATVDGKTYSSSASYTASATNPENLSITASSASGADLKFSAKVEQNILILTMTDAGGDAQFAPFVNIPVTLNRAL